jgi:hypothetical protein
MFSLSWQRPYGLPFIVAAIIAGFALERSRGAWHAIGVHQYREPPPRTT